MTAERPSQKLKNTWYRISHQTDISGRMGKREFFKYLLSKGYKDDMDEKEFFKTLRNNRNLLVGDNNA